MRRLRLSRTTWTLVVTGLLAGGLAGVVTVPHVSSAVAQDASAPGAVLDVTHLPPLLTLPGESMELAYDAHCAAAGVEDPEAACRVEGALFARPAGDGAFRELPFGAASVTRRQFVAHVPAMLMRGARAVDYYAVFASADAVTTVTVPPGGAAAPSVSRVLADTTEIALGRHAFGESRRYGQRLAFARWGDGPDEVGLEVGRGLDPVGASAFDVEADGSILVLDHAHRRLLRWDTGATAPVRVPLSVNGAIADIAAAADGSFYVLETTSRDERAPLLRRFDGNGRELEAVEAAERSPTQVRVGPDGPIVLQRPSHQWMPAFVAGVPATPSAQRRRGRMGRVLRSGEEIVAFRHANELRIALVANGAINRAWRITSETALGEVQLAEPLGGRLVVVVRVYDERADEFAVLLLDRRGLVSRTTLESSEWAESAPLSRFRLAGRDLYRLGSSPEGVFVDRFDLEVRR
jgi:hypothetical protein